MLCSVFKADEVLDANAWWVRFPCAPAIFIMSAPFGLLDFFTAGHRPAEEWGIGLEGECFCLDSSGASVSYFGENGIAQILEFWAESDEWTGKYEGEHIVSLHAEDGRAITLEPGGQIEFGTTPCRDIDSLSQELKGFQAMFDRASEKYGYQFLRVGVHPSAEPGDIKRLPKARYDILEPHLAEADDLGLHMMKTTAGIQVNFDHSDPEDAMLKLRTCFALSPVIQALYVNSPKNGFASWRGHIWTRTDNARCGIVESLVAEGSTLEDYVNYMLDVPMLFIEREGKFVDMRNKSFRDYYASGEATQEDWALHLSTPFPEVRFRPQIELRCADAVDSDKALSLATLVETVFYNRKSLERAWSLTAAWTYEQRVAALHEAHHYALKGKAPDGRELGEFADELIRIALEAASPVQKSYLNPLKQELAI